MIEHPKLPSRFRRSVFFSSAASFFFSTTAPAAISAQVVRLQVDSTAIIADSLLLRSRADTRWATGNRVGMGVLLMRATGEIEGAFVTYVGEGTPAERAGIVLGDIITKIDGYSLLEPLPQGEPSDVVDPLTLPVDRVLSLQESWKEGQKISVEYVRDREHHHTTQVEVGHLAEMPAAVRLAVPDQVGTHVYGGHIYRGMLDAEGVPQAYSPPPISLGQLGDTDGVRLYWRSPPGSASQIVDVRGLEVTDMSKGLSSYFETDKGVLVLDVEDGSPLGVQPGDVIFSIDGREVQNSSRARRILGSYDADEEVSLTIVRQGKEMVVAGKVPAKTPRVP